MAVTTLTTSTRPENAGASMAYFDLLSSTADTGTARQGYGYWWVRRAGVTIKTAQGLRFAYTTRNTGDEVFARFVDSAGNSGGDASYTFTVGSTFDGEQFVKAAGNNGNAGTSDGAAVQTIIQAITNSRAAWSTDDVRAINLNAGETFATSSAGATNCWTMDQTGHIVIRKYGSGANPIISLPSSGNGSVLFGGTIGVNAITVIDCDIQSTYTMGGAVNHSGVVVCSGLHASAVRASIVFIGTDITSVGTGFVFSTGETLADRGKMDYIALCDGKLDVYTGGAGSPSTGGHGLIGMDYGQKLLCQDWEWGRTDGANGFVRGVAWKEMVFDNVLFDRQNTGAEGNTFRINGGDRTTTDDYAHEITLHNVRWRRCGEGLEIEPVSADADGFKNIEMVACSGDFNGTGFLSSLMKCVVSTTNDPHLDGFRALGCWSRQNERVPMFNLNAGSTGVMDDLLFSHNCVVSALDGEFFTSNVMLLTQSGSGVADDAITLQSNYAFGLGTGAGGETPVSLFTVTSAAKINGASDNNVIRKAAGYLFFCNEGGGNRSLATWQGLSTADDQSVEGTGTSNLTDTGAGTFDARPASGSGVQINAGLAGDLIYDADGNLFTTSTPDAGPFQDGGAAPTDPDFGGGGGDTVVVAAPLTLKLNLRI